MLAIRRDDMEESMLWEEQGVSAWSVWVILERSEGCLVFGWSDKTVCV